MQIERIFKIALAVMAGFVLITGFFTLKQDGIDPASDDIEKQLGDIGYTEVTIGAPPHDNDEDARRQMEGLIVWNAAAASDCRFLATTHIQNQIAYGDELADAGIEPSEKPLRWAKNKDWEHTGNPKNARTWILGTGSYEDGNKSKVVKNNSNAVVGFDGFGPLIESGFTKRCLGSESVINKIKNAAKSAANSAIGKVVGPLKTGLTIVAVVGGGIAIAGCAVASGGLCAVGGTVAAAAIIGGTGTAVAGAGSAIALDLTNRYLVPKAQTEFDDDPAFDMEGKFGRIKFRINESFHFAKGGVGKPLWGQNFKAGGWKDGKTAGFWRGRRFMYALPPGLKPVGEKGKEYHAIHPAWQEISKYDGYKDYGGVGDGRVRIRALYSWRVRMKDVPIITDGFSPSQEERITNFRRVRDSHDPSPVKIIRTLLRNSQYLFCRGARGYVQSNAKKMFNEGEAVGNKGKKEDNVYPFVKITEGATSCLDPGASVHEIEDDNDDGGQDIRQKFYQKPSYIDGDDWLDSPFFNGCDLDDMGDRDILFAREMTDGDKYKSGLVCGGKDDNFTIGHENSDWATYKNDRASKYSDEITYWTPEGKYAGCSSKPYELENGWDADVSGEDSTDGFSWVHYAHEKNATGNRVERTNQVNYREMMIDYERDYEANTSYVIKVNYDSGIDTQKIYVQDVNGGEYYKLAKRKGDQQAQFVDRKDTDRTGPQINLKFYGLDGKRFNLGSNFLPTESKDRKLTKINISTLGSEEVERLNDDLDSDNHFNASQAEFGLEEVTIRGPPRICVDSGLKDY
jgi:hypothetical protein